MHLQGTGRNSSETKHLSLKVWGRGSGWVEMQLDCLPSGVQSSVSPCPNYFLTSAANPEWSEQMWFLLLHSPLATLRLGACGQTKQPTGRQCGEQQESWQHCDSRGTLRRAYSSRQKTLSAAVYTCSLPHSRAVEPPVEAAYPWAEPHTQY